VENFLAVATNASTPRGAIMQAFWIPESPRFLWSQGQDEKALSTLRVMASWNRSLRQDCISIDPSFESLNDPAVQLAPPDSSMGPVIDQDHCGTRLPFLARLQRQTWLIRQQVAFLLTPTTLPVTVPLAVAWFGLSGGWYGLLLWFPEYMKRHGAEPLEIYLEMLLVALSNLPGAQSSLSNVAFN